MDLDYIDDAACAASDLTARLRAEVSQALAELAIADARALTALGSDLAIPSDLRNERVLLRQKLQVLGQLLDGMPEIDGGDHALSA